MKVDSGVEVSSEKSVEESSIDVHDLVVGSALESSESVAYAVYRIVGKRELGIGTWPSLPIQQTRAWALYF
jgi:hypothetical protein